MSVRPCFPRMAGLAWAFAVLLLNCGFVPMASAAFSPGDIFVNQFSGGLQQYSSSGALIRNFGGTGTTFEGVAFTPNGNVVTTFRNGGATGGSGIDIFNSSGTQIVSFNTAAISTPGDVSVFADGTIAVSDQGNNLIREYSQTGLLIRSLSTNQNDPFGSTIGSDNNLYTVGLNGNSIGRFTETGASLGSLGLTFGAADLVRANDGSFYVAGNTDGMVHHISSTGVDLNDFASGFAAGNFSGIALSPDQQSLYLSGYGSSNLLHRTFSGNLLSDSFTLSGSTPIFLAVYPSAVPEPSSLAMLGLGLAGVSLLARKHWGAS